MTNYVILYTGDTTPDNEEDMQRIMADWGAWYGQIGDAVVDGGNPFGHSKSITDSGVHDGPYGETPATGYTIIKADSLDEACGLCENHPHIKHGGQVSVFETFEM